MNDAGIEVSLFIAPDEKQIEASARAERNLSSCTRDSSRRDFLVAADVRRLKLQNPNLVRASLRRLLQITKRNAPAQVIVTL